MSLMYYANFLSKLPKYWLCVEGQMRVVDIVWLQLQNCSGKVSCYSVLAHTGQKGRTHIP